MASSDVLTPRSYADAHRYDGAAIQHDRAPALVPCALQPRDVAIVRDVWRYKFLTAPQLLELWWPGCVGPRRPAAAAASSSTPAISSGSARSRAGGSFPWTYHLGAGGPPPARSDTASSPTASATVARGDLRLQPRPARAPAQRLGPRLPARRSATRSARLGGRDRHRPADRGRARASCASTTTGRAEGTPRRRSRGSSAPTPSSRSPSGDDGAPATFLIEYDRTRRVDKNYDEVPPLRRLPELVVAPHAARRPRRAAVRALRLPGRRPARAASSPPPTAS